MGDIGFSHLRLLAIFATVVECGSFAAAARKLGTSRSRISEQVAQLETDMGVRLLQRSTRKLNITQEGETIYQEARQLPMILQGVEAVTTTSIPSGRVAITMNHDIAHKYLLPILPAFEQAYPQIQLDLVLDDSRTDLIAEQIDLAIRIGIPKDDSVVARMLHKERFILAASPDLSAQYGKVDSIDKLSELPWVVMNLLGNRSQQDLLCDGENITITPSRFYRCNSPLMVQQMVVNGRGIACLLPSTVKSELAEGKLIQLMPSITSEPLVISLVYPSRRQVPSRTRAVIDFLLGVDMFAPSIKAQ